MESTACPSAEPESSDHIHESLIFQDQILCMQNHVRSNAIVDQKSEHGLGRSFPELGNLIGTVLCRIFYEQASQH